MKYPFAASATALALLMLAACGGGGSGSGGGNPYAPVSNPTAAPPSTPASMPQTATVNGGQAFVSASNQHTLYTWAGDTAGVSNCTAASGCAGIWPAATAPAGTVAPSGTGFGIITRSDGSLQWTYQNFPLYMYSGDAAAGQGNGNGINSFGGIWGIARPAGASPGPTSSPSHCVGYYC